MRVVIKGWWVWKEEEIPLELLQEQDQEAELAKANRKRRWLL
jgi:hypothetical protein